MRKPSVHLLCCSRAIYEEITDRLIDFSRAPYHKINLVIHIYAPDPRDPGQIILLWQKVQYLVDILGNATAGCASLVIRLRAHKGCDWQAGGRVVESIPYPNSRRPDHSVVFGPFCRVSNVGSLRVISDSRSLDRVADWGFVNYGREFILNNGYQNYNDGPLSRDRQYRDLTRNFDDIETSWIRDTNFFFEMRLDDLPGDTATMLRLDRAAHWSLGPWLSNARVRCWILDVRQCPNSVRLYDPGPRRFTRRDLSIWQTYKLSRYKSHLWSWSEWRMSADEGSLIRAAQGRHPSPDGLGAREDHLLSSLFAWWGPEEYSWLLVKESNDVSLDPVEQVKRHQFLLELGDYLGRVWNCLVKASKAKRTEITSRVVKLPDKLTEESRDSSKGDKPKANALDGCVRYLQDKGFDIDFDMAKIAILGIEEVAKKLAAMEKEIAHANTRLPQILPKASSRTKERGSGFLPSTAPPRSLSNSVLVRGLTISCPNPIFASSPKAHVATINERFPLTSLPVPGQTRTRHSVSDPIHYVPQKRRASESPDSDGHRHGKTIVSLFPTAALGNVVDACQFQELYSDLGDTFDKNRKIHRTLSIARGLTLMAGREWWISGRRGSSRLTLGLSACEAQIPTRANI
ncbi:hypothetical protein BO71DRAFT_430555 [Aspergillus ellipticus CBS 707.79]|uniref:Uncharacterized protein n=1 Tax=Aspergillus ellipticus CBS 707.79 TaxID=1448320 RepID=A0A319D9K1_9EURO|nr:hypothetical protein BO71DRAFT_430555 [Aspergillus ellipticus CBS 707.79]